MEIEHLQHACPICKGEVSGNEQVLYFCKNCNVLFRKQSLEHQ